MVMKISRHSQKMLVYSLSLLLSAQQILCTPPQFDVTDQMELKKTIDALPTTNARIDMMQQTLGAVLTTADVQQVNPAESGFETIDLGNKVTTIDWKNIDTNWKINNQNLDETQETLVEMHKQLLTYQAKTLFSFEESRKTNENGKKAKTMIYVVMGFAHKKKHFEPNLSIIPDGLPENPKDLNALSTINALQLTLGEVDDNKKFLGKSIGEFKQDLATKNLFFQDLQGSCCCATPTERDTALKHKIYLRAITIPLICFAQKQKTLSQQIQSYQNPNTSSGGQSFQQSQIWDPFSTQNYK